MYRTWCIDGVYTWYLVVCCCVGIKHLPSRYLEMTYEYLVPLFPFPVFVLPVDPFDAGSFSMSSCGELLFGGSNDEKLHTNIKS